MSFRPVFPVLGKPPLSVRSGNFCTRSEFAKFALMPGTVRMSNGYGITLSSLNVFMPTRNVATVVGLTM